MNRLLALALPLFVAAAQAGTGQGTVAKLESGPQYGSRFFITIDGAVTGQPPCRAENNYHFVFDTAAPGGKDLLATVLLAKATKQNVVVSGYNQCGLYNGVEDLRWFRLE